MIISEDARTRKSQRSGGIDRESAKGTNPSGFAASHIVLRVYDRTDGGYTLHHVEGQRCSLGSSRTCTVQLAGSNVRPVHCVILRGRDRSIVRRWSPNTWLNGKFFTDAVLHEGDELTVGGVRVQVAEDNRSSRPQDPVPCDLEPLPFDQPHISGLPPWQTAELGAEDTALHARVRATEARIGQLTRQLVQSQSRWLHLANQLERQEAGDRPGNDASEHPGEDKTACHNVPAPDAIDSLVTEHEQQRQQWQLERERMLAELARYEDHASSESLAVSIECAQPTVDPTTTPILTSNLRIDQDVEELRSSVGFDSQAWGAAQAEAEQRLADITSREVALQERETSLDARHRQLEERDQDLQEWADKLDGFRRELDHQSEDIQRRSTADVQLIDELKAALDAAQADFDQRLAAFTEREAVWQQTELDWKQQVAELEQTISELQREQAAAIERQAAADQDRVSLMTDLNNQVAELERELAQARQLNAELQQQIIGEQDHQSEISGLRDQVLELEQELTNAHEQHAALEQQTQLDQEHQHDISELHDQNMELEQELQQARELIVTLEQQTAANQDHQNQINDLTNQVADLEQELQKARELAAALEQQVAGDQDHQRVVDDLTSRIAEFEQELSQARELAAENEAHLSKATLLEEQFEQERSAWNIEHMSLLNQLETLRARLVSAESLEQNPPTPMTAEAPVAGPKTLDDQRCSSDLEEATWDADGTSHRESAEAKDETGEDTLTGAHFDPIDQFVDTVNPQTGTQGESVEGDVVEESTDYPAMPADYSLGQHSEFETEQVHPQGDQRALAESHAGELPTGDIEVSADQNLVPDPSNTDKMIEQAALLWHEAKEIDSTTDQVATAKDELLPSAFSTDDQLSGGTDTTSDEDPWCFTEPTHGEFLSAKQQPESDAGDVDADMFAQLQELMLAASEVDAANPTGESGVVSDPDVAIEGALESPTEASEAASLWPTSDAEATGDGDSFTQEDDRYDQPFELEDEVDNGSDWFEATEGVTESVADAEAESEVESRSDTDAKASDESSPVSFLEQFQSMSSEASDVDEVVGTTDQSPTREDDSIDDYMQRLLQRVGQGEIEQEVMPEVDEPTPEPEQNEQPKRVPRRRPKPVRHADLQAMREIANESARNAIVRHDKYRHGTSAIMNLGITIAAALVGAILIVLSGFKISILSGVGALMEVAAVYFGFRSFSSGALVMLKRFDKLGTAKAADSAPDELGENSDLEEAEQEMPSPAEEESARVAEVTPEQGDDIGLKEIDGALFEQVTNELIDEHALDAQDGVRQESSD